MNQDQKLRDLATLPVGRLLWRYSLPAVTGMLVMSLYNVVDRIFIGQGVGPEAIAGLAVTFPVINITTALGVLVGAGSSSRVSILLGQGRHAEAERTLGNSLVMLVIFATCYMSLFYWQLDPILRLFGASDATIPYARDLISTLLPGLFMTNLAFSLNNIMRASGYPARAMMTMVIGAVVNVILDPIFIFGLDIGIRGAAIATDIAMAVCAVFVFAHFFRRDVTVRFRRGTFGLSLRVVWPIIAIGAAPSVVNFAASFINIIINKTLLAHGGDMAVGAAGIFTTYTSLLTTFVLGICLGMQPIVGYNFGAGQLHRLRRAYGLAVAAATAVCVAGYLGACVHHRPRAHRHDRHGAAHGHDGFLLRGLPGGVDHAVPEHRRGRQERVPQPHAPGDSAHSAAAHAARKHGAARRVAVVPAQRHSRHGHHSRHGVVGARPSRPHSRTIKKCLLVL